MDIKNYTLRARAVEGNIPMPQVAGRPEYEGLTANNFEIFCSYSKENLNKLFEIGKQAYENDTLSKFEILGWAGGAANEDGNRFLWLFRPDLSDFDKIPDALNVMFNVAEPRPMTKELNEQYNKHWSPLKFGFSLKSYEELALKRIQPSLDSQIAGAKARSACSDSISHKSPAEYVKE